MHIFSLGKVHQVISMTPMSNSAGLSCSIRLECHNVSRTGGWAKAAITYKEALYELGDRILGLRY